MKRSTYILGINSAYHELSACLLKNGELLAAAEEERFSRVKRGKKALVDNPDALPIQAMNFCLDREGISLGDVQAIGLSFSPKDRLKQINIDKYFIEGDWGSEAGEKLFYNKLSGIPSILSKLTGTDVSEKVHWVPHHVSHAASAYLVSPYDQAAILSIDGIGEISTAWLGKGEGNTMTCLKEIQYPHSLGFVWEKMSKFLGFSEYDSAKVMGLAAYGNAEVFYPQFQQLIQLKPKGEFTVNNDIFQFRLDNYAPLEEHFGVKRINSPAERTAEHENLAAALQKITNDILLHCTLYLSEATGLKNLCLAGGVALNCVANQKVMESNLFKSVYIQPAANDAGTALGAAYYIWNQILQNDERFTLDHVYWGPDFSQNEIDNALSAVVTEVQYTQPKNLEKEVATVLSKGQIVGWFQGRMEWGPRALGNRSLLADPRNPEMKDILNHRIKRREPFRPFAPSVLEEDIGEWFVEFPHCESISTQFMEINFDVQPEKRQLIPAVVHVDGTSRIQAVSKKTNPKYHRLISEFKKITGVPLVLNTSFNDNEPIVCTPQDALKTFLRTKMDFLVLGDYLIRKRS